MMITRLRYLLLIVTIFSIGLLEVKATHLRAGDITVKRDCNSNTFYITLHVYTRTNVQTKFSYEGAGSLNFGDGSDIHHPPTIDFPDPRIRYIGQSDNGPIGEVTYTVTHTYGSNGFYTITYTEPNRDEGILNIDDSVDTPFFMETNILIDDGIGCDNSPQLLVPPIDQGCTGVKWFHNPGAYDPDGDSLSYEKYIPKQGATYDENGFLISSLDVNGYVDPNAAKFCSSTNCKETPGVGAATYQIDAVTGTITWDAPQRKGEYNVAFIIKEWRKIFGKWHMIGYVERDMQIVIQDCTNQRPQLQVPANACVIADSLLIQNIYATDLDGSPLGGAHGKGDSVKIQAYSQIFTIIPSSAKISPGTAIPDAPVWQPTFSPSDQATIQFSWQTVCQHIKEQPYEVVFKATDNGSPPLSTFATWNIQVIGPKPKWNSITLNPSQRSSQLSWNSYECKSSSNASVMQIWRRVDTAPYTPGPCDTGIPDSLGYVMIAQVPIGNTSYTDTKLAVGAEYCYRLVAAFSDGSLSQVSAEYCIPPILADAPIITNVSVDSTDVLTGKIIVKWRSPFQANQAQFPKPYTFVVKRAEGFNGNTNLKIVTAGQQKDSTFIDDGLNTRDIIYNYRVLAYDSNRNFVDSSAIASSVRLDLKPQFKQVLLAWSADVPWSISDPAFPKHLIYRTTNSSAETINELTLIDSVNVLQSKLTYLDSGKYQNQALDPNQNYCYAVMTKGSYGNPKIKVPLKNFSQITCAIPSDTVAPCKPVIVTKGTKCKTDFNTYCPVNGNYDADSVYNNTIQWKRPADPKCLNNIRGYNIYAAYGTDQEFTLIATLVRDTFYTDTKLTSFARCYKVSGVNRAGIEGELSNSFCFDNCPYYQLPNVFSPNGDGCNDLFSAYNDLKYSGDLDSYPNGKYPCNATSEDVTRLKSLCARYVLSVDFKVYNRWGREVYSYHGNYNDPDGSNGVFINWNGKDNSGRDLDGGVYYYGANVVFNVIDPKKRNQTIKGWVQIIR